MVYPVIILIVTVVILSGLMVVVVPQFETIYSDLLKGASLPALTQGVLATADFVKNRYLLGLMIIIGLVVAYKLPAVALAWAGLLSQLLASDLLHRWPTRR
jgi:type IV pilus assembly protein PilC